MSNTHASLKIIGTRLLLLATVLGVLVTTTPPARAQSYSVLYRFAGGNDGGNPWAGLIFDTQGNLYGTTKTGGGKHCGEGCGTVFKLASDGTETVLYSFTGGTDWKRTTTPLARDRKGNLYGTTQKGGTHTMSCPVGCGTVFEVTPAGAEATLYSFAGGADGKQPLAGLVLDTQGNLYGTTYLGGAHSRGTVFQITPGGTHTILYSFRGGKDGQSPESGLVLDAQGNLYGTTPYPGGAHKWGTVFEVTPAGTETTLYSFTGGGDGGWPFAGLVRDAQGNLYGTTYVGGAFDHGTVFEVTASGTEKVLYSFTGGADGSSPQWATLAGDAQGNLYGIASDIVFKLTPTGTETALYAFTNEADGRYPIGGLVLDMEGNLYGTTSQGGASGCEFEGQGCGVVFKLTP